MQEGEDGCQEQALKIAKEAKPKGKKERYTHQNAEFQSKQRDKKAFSVMKKRKAIRTGKRDLFKKIRGNPGYISCKRQA